MSTGRRPLSSRARPVLFVLVRRRFCGLIWQTGAGAVASAKPAVDNDRGNANVVVAHRRHPRYQQFCRPRRRYCRHCGRQHAASPMIAFSCAAFSFGDAVFPVYHLL